jgi:DNA polymerase
LHLYLNPQIQIDCELGEELKKKMKVEMLKPLKDLYDLGIDVNQEDISGDKSFLDLLNQQFGPNEQVPTKAGKNGMIPALAREDEGMKYLCEQHSNQKVRALATARLAISSWPLHTKRVDKLINQAKTHNGKIGAPLTYYAGHTGRWGGTEGINLQNLGGRGRKGSGTHPLIREVRQMLCAPDGCVFGIADFSQIEARILAWLAGQDDLIQAFAEGRDVYSEFATEDLFREPIRKAKKSDPEPVAKMLTFKRGFAKDAILGCGYGMGTARFFDDCYANDALRPAFDSGQYDFRFIEGLIKAYRTRYSKIPEFWRTVEKAWKFVTKYPREDSPYCLEEGKVLLHFYNQNGTTIIQLPSGRNIYYPHASVNSRGDLLWRWGKLWGGSITENIVQATARDVLAESILYLTRHNINIIFHVHDEIICLLEKTSAEEILQEITEAMEKTPYWAHGLPIAVEGKLVERYEK